jgi:ABC-type transport system substrate-binding protein
MMMSKQAFDTNGQEYIEQHPVGTGPFVFDNYATGVSMEWTRNNDYWMEDEQGNQLPYLDGLKTVYITDAMTQLAAMQSGDVMMMSGGGGITYVNLEEAGFNVFPSPLANTFSIIPDTKNADSPWADPKVREAVTYCLDREAIAQIAELKFGLPAYQLSNPKNLSYNPDVSPIPYDLDKAKQLMAESSHPNGFDTDIYTLVFTGKDTMVAIQSCLAEIGINAEVNLLSFGEGSELQVAGWHNGCYCSPNSNLLNFNFALGLQSAWGKNAMTDVASMDIPAEFQPLLDQALSGENEDRAKSKAAAKLLQDDFLVIPVYYANSMWALSPIIQGLDCAIFQNSLYQTIWKAWLSEE